MALGGVIDMQLFISDGVGCSITGHWTFKIRSIMVYMQVTTVSARAMANFLEGSSFTTGCFYKLLRGTPDLACRNTQGVWNERF